MPADANASFTHPGITVVYNSARGPGVYDESSSSWRYKFTSTDRETQNQHWTPEDESKVLPEVRKILGATKQELEEFVRSAFQVELAALGSHALAINITMYKVVEIDSISNPKTITLASGASQTSYDITHADYSQLHINFSKGDPIFAFQVSSSDSSFPSASSGFARMDGEMHLVRFVCRDTDETQFPSLWKYPYYTLAS